MSNENTSQNSEFLMTKEDIHENIQEKSKASDAGKQPSYDPKDFLSFEEVKTLDKKYLLQTYQRMPIHFVRGSGEFVYDTNDREYIDFLSGIAVNSLGHAHPDLIETLTHQADMLWHTSNLYYNQQQAQLARALVEISFPGKVFFANSGAEANEAAIKLMRAHGQQSSKHKPEKIVSLKNSFHGRTFNSMSVTGQSKIHDGFGTLLTPVEYVEINNIEALDKAIDAQTCGVILESVQGEGGVIPLDHEFVKAARKFTAERGVLLVFDEVQTGIGRTGKYFGFQHYDIVPDAISVAKGLAGGFPIGALIVAEPYTDVLKAGMHGSTFGGNHLACAVGYEVLRTIESSRILENVDRMSYYLITQLHQLAQSYSDRIEEIRGMGLLLGIALRDEFPARPLVAKALEKGLLIGRAGTSTLRLAPPLLVRKNTAERALAILEELIRSLDK